MGSAIFGMFTQFLHAHMKIYSKKGSTDIPFVRPIYRNLTPNITKGQKWVKKGSKIGKNIVEIKNANRNTIYECNFWHVTQFINVHMTIYRILTPNITKGK